MPHHWPPLLSVHEQKSFFKCKQHTIHDPKGPHWLCAPIANRKKVDFFITFKLHDLVWHNQINDCPNLWNLSGMHELYNNVTLLKVKIKMPNANPQWYLETFILQPSSILHLQFIVCILVFIATIRSYLWDSLQDPSFLIQVLLLFYVSGYDLFNGS